MQPHAQSLSTSDLTRLLKQLVSDGIYIPGADAPAQQPRCSSRPPGSPINDTVSSGMARAALPGSQPAPSHDQPSYGQPASSMPQGCPESSSADWPDVVTRRYAITQRTTADADTTSSTSTTSNGSAALLHAGVPVTGGQGHAGWTALMVAAEEGRLEVVNLLLQQPGVDADCSNSDGETALNIAAWNGKAGVVACLLAAGASPHLADHAGVTAMEYAILKIDVPVVEAFLDFGVQPPAYPIDHLRGNQNPSLLAMGALFDALKPSGFAVNQASVMGSVFIHTMSGAFADGNDKYILRQLTDNGMTMACAFHVAAMSRRARAASMANASMMQKQIYSLCALCRLGFRSTTEELVEFYGEAGVSPAGAIRLGAIASTQLGIIAALANESLTNFANKMLGALVDKCTVGTGLDYQVDIAALKTRLIGHGFCAPVALAIARSWQSAVTKPPEKTGVSTIGWLWSLATYYLGTRTVSYNQRKFALALLHQIKAPDLQGELVTAFGGVYDETLHTQFAFQVDQLQQYGNAIFITSADPGPDTGTAVEGEAAL